MTEGRRGQVIVMIVKVLSPNGKIPTRATEFSAGLDLYSISTVTIPVGGIKTINTGISVEMDPGTYGRVAPRSGLAVRHGIDTLAGVIDGDYRGEVIVVLINHGLLPFEVTIGMRVAQLIVESCVIEKVVLVAGSAERGCRGFGSSGI